MFEQLTMSSRYPGTFGQSGDSLQGHRTSETVFTVDEINQIISLRLKAPELTSVSVRGQISGMNSASSGHWYFDLKSAEGQILSCAVWKSHQTRMTRPKNGDEVVVHGTVSFYAKSGKVTFSVDALRADGQSELYLRYLALRDRLKAEGLFDLERKRMLPKKPGKIAVVTSQFGAVIHDVCRVARARDPGVCIMLVPVKVQGDEAAPQIVRGIQVAGMMDDVDIVILCRGGGSMEDLWCFNDERVVRAVAACPVPVVAGIGHDTDLTLCEMAADVRAATPSQAAELSIPDRSGIRRELKALRESILHGAQALLGDRAMRVEKVRGRMEKGSPVARIDRTALSASMLRVRLEAATDSKLEQEQHALGAAQMRLDQAVRNIPQEKEKQLIQLHGRIDKASPERQIQELGEKLQNLRGRMNQAMHLRMVRDTGSVERLQAKISAMDPGSVLERGYAFVTDEMDHVVTSTAQATTAMTLHFHDGTVRVVPSQRQGG